MTILNNFWLISPSVTINFSKMITNPSHHDDELQVKTRSQRRRYLLHLSSFQLVVALIGSAVGINRTAKAIETVGLHQQTPVQYGSQIGRFGRQHSIDFCVSCQERPKSS